MKAHGREIVKTNSSLLPPLFYLGSPERIKNPSGREVLSGKVTAIYNSYQIADALAVSADYLGSVVKKETGRTVTKWIKERTVMEAQSLIKNTSCSISEISYRLTFQDPTNFTKYFKKNTGFSPKQYREQ
ncbi:MAG: helix-turn-helix domain-containing protein [Bacteroidota bacterium]